MSKIFIYGFGPYQEFKTNITSEIINLLPNSTEYTKHIFNVEFDREMFETKLNEIKPSFILGLGQSRDNEKLRIERNAKNQKEKSQIDSEAPETIITHTWQIPDSEICEYSEDAGSYVCNYSIWVISNWANRNNAKFAFIHIPHKFEILSAYSYISSQILKI